MNALTIANHSIRTSGDLYSLNDLHRSSGNEPRHKPSNFMANKQTQELIQAIEAEGNIAYHTVQGGNAKQQGTFVCREIVIAYACWISAHFHLVVLRAFDALNTGAIPCLDRPRLSDFQAFTLQKAVRAKCGGNRSHYQALYRTLYHAFGVNSYKNILADDFDEAMAIVEHFQYAQPPQIRLTEINRVLGTCAVRLIEYSKLLSQLQDFGHIPSTGYDPNNSAKQALQDLVDMAYKLGIKDEHGRPYIRTNGVAWYCGSAMLFE